MRRFFKRFSKLLLALLLPAVLLAACTNSRLVLRPLYNSLDDRIQKTALNYTDFSEQQTADIKALVDHFHVWHRQTQLSHYAALAGTVADRLSLDEPITAESVAFWSASLREYADTVGRCNPLYRSHDIIASLDDQQVADLQKNREEILFSRQADDSVDFEGGSAGESLEDEEDPVVSRQKRQAQTASRIRRYIELAGLDVTESQFNDYKKTLSERKYPETRFRNVLQEWDQRFFKLLDRRNEGDWPDVLREYIDARRSAFSARRDDVRAHNTMLWEAYAVRTFNGLSPEQRRFVGNWLAKLSVTLSSLAADTPSYKAAGAADYKCTGVKILG